MIALLALLSALSFQAATRLGVYTYSLDSNAGFQDELVDLFRRELGKHVAPFGEMAYSRAEADVAVQLLGQGELTLQLGGDGEPEGYLFEPDEGARRLWALVHVGDYSRAFAVEGSGGRKMSELGKAIADWINDRSTAIRERRLAR
jgi:hypothetical protein